MSSCSTLAYSWCKIPPKTSNGIGSQRWKPRRHHQNKRLPCFSSNARGNTNNCATDHCSLAHLSNVADHPSINRHHLSAVSIAASSLFGGAVLATLLSMLYAAAAGGAAVGGAAAGGAAAGGIKSAFLSLAEPFNVTAPTSLVSRLQRSLTSGKLVRFSIPLQGLYKRQHCLTCCSIRTTGELTSTVPVLTRPLISAYNNPNTIGE